MIIRNQVGLFFDRESIAKCYRFPTTFRFKPGMRVFYTPSCRLKRDFLRPSGVKRVLYAEEADVIISTLGMSDLDFRSFRYRSQFHSSHFTQPDFNFQNLHKYRANLSISDLYLGTPSVFLNLVRVNNQIDPYTPHEMVDIAEHINLKLQYPHTLIIPDAVAVTLTDRDGVLTDDIVVGMQTILQTPELSVTLRNYDYLSSDRFLIRSILDSLIKNKYSRATASREYYVQLQNVLQLQTILELQNF